MNIGDMMKNETNNQEKSIKEVYTELTNKYKNKKLPGFDELNLYFEISTIEGPDFLLRHIIKKIAERMEGFAGIIEDLMQGDTKMSNMYEWKALDDDTKNELMEVYRTIMAETRAAVELSLEPSEEKEAEYLAAIFGVWTSIRPKLKSFVSKLKNSWKKDISVSEKLAYMG